MELLMKKDKHTPRCHSEGNFVGAEDRFPHKDPYRMTFLCVDVLFRFKQLLIFFLLLTNIVFAQSYTVSGYVVNNESGETLIGVNIIVVGQTKGAATDNNGFFRIPGLAPGKYQLEFSYIGFETHQVDVLIKNESLVLKEIALQPKELQSEEIIITAERSEIIDTEVETSPVEITQEAIRSIPAGRKDLFRTLKYLPGIEGIDPFSPLYAVRGSDPGENLVLLDGVTIYNPYHFVTASGLFNAYAIKKAEILVGGFGAEYGGRNSSVLYITTREGNNKKLHGEIEPTTTLTQAIFDFPISENATMMVSGRFFYDLFARFLFNMPNNFYDTNISLNWKINDYNRLNFRFFHSGDYLDYSFARFSHYFKSMLPEEDKDIFDNYDVIYNNTWHNNAVSLSLKTIVTPSIYLQTQLSGSFFSADNRTFFYLEVEDEENNETIKLNYRTDIKNKISDISAKSFVNISFASWNSFKFGAEFNSYSFSNDIRINRLGEGEVKREPNLVAGFFEDKITWGNFSIRPGIRISKFNFADNWYREPRVNAVLNLPLNWKLKAAWGEYYQYIISINSQDYELSQFLDYYYPLKSREPSASNHYIFGIEKSFFDDYNFSADFYYKKLNRVYTYDYNASAIDIFKFADKLKAGRGESYGVEFLLNGKWKNFSGWISYGISKSTRSYHHIMNGKTFLFDYDRTHSFKAVGQYHVNPSLSFSGTLRIQSGVPKTLESGEKSYFYYDPQTGEYAYYPTYINDVKNNTRMPYFLRLDLGMKKRIRKGFGAELANYLGANESYFNLSIGNVLFFLHRNVIWYFPLGFEKERKLYGLGSNYIPELSVGYTVKF